MSLWDAIINMRKIELELIPHSDAYIFFEKGSRGGISYISNRYRKANNKYLKSYNSKEESKHIIYFDANHLYGYAMSKFFPTNGFKQIDPKQFDLIKYTSNSSKRFVLKVDLKYSKQLGEFHNDYYLVPDKTEIKREILSEYLDKDC